MVTGLALELCRLPVAIACLPATRLASEPCRLPVATVCPPATRLASEPCRLLEATARSPPAIATANRPVTTFTVLLCRPPRHLHPAQSQLPSPRTPPRMQATATTQATAAGHLNPSARHPHRRQPVTARAAQPPLRRAPQYRLHLRLVQQDTPKENPRPCLPHLLARRDTHMESPQMYLPHLRARQDTPM